MHKRKKFPKNGPYANLMTDLIFKKVFNPDDAYTKINLINFLNDILKDQIEDPIEDVFSLDKETNASGSHASRTSIFDLHCRDTKKRVFIVEVQIRQMEFFLKRSFSTQARQSSGREYRERVTITALIRSMSSLSAGQISLTTNVTYTIFP